MTLELFMSGVSTRRPPVLPIPETLPDTINAGPSKTTQAQRRRLFPYVSTAATEA